MLKNEAEKLSVFDGKFSKSEIADFIFSNKLPLVTIFTRESAPLIFESPIKKQLLLFAISNDSEKVVPIFKRQLSYSRESLSLYMWKWTMKMLGSLFQIILVSVELLPKFLLTQEMMMLKNLYLMGSYFGQD